MKFSKTTHLFIATFVALLVSANGFSLPSRNNRISTTSTRLASSSSSSSSGGGKTASKKADDSFIFRSFAATDIDDNNSPPYLHTILRNLRDLTHQGSDIRGRFVDHPRLGRISSVARAIDKNDGIPALTPFGAFCLGHAFGQLVLQQQSNSKPTTTTIAMGRDPRSHGTMLCDAFGRGIQTASPERIRVVYTGIATTPSMFHFCRAGLCDGAVMVTASHLPGDRNGFKLFTPKGGFTKYNVQQMNRLAADFAQKWHDREGMMMLPPTSGGEGVFCSEWVDFMPHYATTLRDAICSEVQQQEQPSDNSNNKPLDGLTIVLNSGNGSGGFFHAVLEGLGADVSASVGIEPNSDFPNGIPNPEKKQMIADTIAICQDVKADLGILLDTDADRSGFVVPVGDNGDEFEPLNRNRLIALLSVIFSRASPGCAIVTDSVTSEGLADFIQQNLGLQHVRYLKGYANVIGKAQELTNSGQCNAEMAIETSGHCAMKENGYLDDGTYTAVKVIGLLAREKLQNGNSDLLGLISDLKEMPEDVEIRMNSLDGSLETMAVVFDRAAREIEDLCSSQSSGWSLDTENLEGIRVRTGNGGFFMLRKSLHDPLVSLQVEAESKQEALENVVRPLLERFQSVDAIKDKLDMTNLEKY